MYNFSQTGRTDGEGATLLLTWTKRKSTLASGGTSCVPRGWSRWNNMFTFQEVTGKPDVRPETCVVVATAEVMGVGVRIALALQAT